MDEDRAVSKKTIAVVAAAALVLLILILRACTGSSEEPVPDVAGVPGAPVAQSAPAPQPGTFADVPSMTVPDAPQAPAPPTPLPVPDILLVMERSPYDPLWLPPLRTAADSPAPVDAWVVPAPVRRYVTGSIEEQRTADGEEDEPPAVNPGRISVVDTEGRQRLCDEIIRFAVNEMDRYGWKFFISETSPPNGLTCRVTLHPASEGRSRVNRSAWTIGGVLTSHLKPLVRDHIACRPIGATQQCRPELHQSAQANSAEFTIGDRLYDGILPVRQTVLGVSTSDYALLIWVY